MYKPYDIWISFDQWTNTCCFKDAMFFKHHLYIFYLLEWSYLNKYPDSFFLFQSLKKKIYNNFNWMFSYIPYFIVRVMNKLECNIKGETKKKFILPFVFDGANPLCRFKFSCWFLHWSFQLIFILRCCPNKWSNTLKLIEIQDIACAKLCLIFAWTTSQSK